MKIRHVIAIIAVALTIFGFTNFKSGKKEMPQNPEIGIKIGQIAPEISLKNMDGETMNLSDFKGKLVLVDFWASWCPPCRAENPYVAKAYKKYKNKEFTNGKKFVVYSISLDGGRRGNEQTWKKAVKDDKLEWDTNFLGNSEVAKKYSIQGIPANFLLDENGVIIATNLRKKALENKLKSLLKQ